MKDLNIIIYWQSVNEIGYNHVYNKISVFTSKNKILSNFITKFCKENKDKTITKVQLF